MHVRYRYYFCTFSVFLYILTFYSTLMSVPICHWMCVTLKGREKSFEGCRGQQMRVSPWRAVYSPNRSPLSVERLSGTLRVDMWRVFIFLPWFHKVTGSVDLSLVVMVISPLALVYSTQMIKQKISYPSQWLIFGASSSIRKDQNFLAMGHAPGAPQSHIPKLNLGSSASVCTTWMMPLLLWQLPPKMHPLTPPLPQWNSSRDGLF